MGTIGSKASGVRAGFVARAVRAFATAKDTPFLSDRIAVKAAIGYGAEVTTSFVSAFAPVVNGKGALVTNVDRVPEAAGLSLVRDMKHDIAFRYSVGGTMPVTLEVVPQHFNRALAEIQLRSENYLAGRSLAPAGGHYLAAVKEEAKAVRAGRKRAKEDAGRAAGQQAPSASRSKSPSKESLTEHDTAYARVQPVHVLVLSDVCYAHDTAGKEWRATDSSPVLAGGKYGWASPLFSTFRLETDAGILHLQAGREDPGPNSFAASLRDRLSITIVHLPLVPSALDDKAAWEGVAALPEHRAALQSAELREWLHFLAHTSVKDGKVEMPPELQTRPIIRKSAERAESILRYLRAPGFFSERDMANLSRQLKREHQVALAAQTAALQEELGKERAAAAAALEKERAAQTAALREELEKERAAAVAAVAAVAALEKERAASEKERAAVTSALREELERLKRSARAPQAVARR